MTDEETAAVRAAIEGELRLLDPAVRSSRTETARLLDPEFTEVGASGRRYTYEDMVAWLPENAGRPGHQPPEITGVLLAPGLAHGFAILPAGSAWQHQFSFDAGHLRWRCTQRGLVFGISVSTSLVIELFQLGH